MRFEINVTSGSLHLFATAPHSLTNRPAAEALYELFKEKFPSEEGYELRLVKVDETITELRTSTTDRMGSFTLFRDMDDFGASITVVDGDKGSIGQYLEDDEFIIKCRMAGAKIKEGIDNRTRIDCRDNESCSKCPAKFDYKRCNDAIKTEA
jgi:hypothetical protein